MELVITTQNQIRPEHVLQACGYDTRCLLPSFPSSVSRFILYGHLLLSQQVWPGRSGLHIVLTCEPMQPQDLTSFLQLGQQVHSHSARAYHDLQQCSSPSIDWLGNRTHCMCSSLHSLIAPPVHLELFVCGHHLDLRCAAQFIEVPLEASEHETLQLVSEWTPADSVPLLQWLPSLDVVVVLNAWPDTDWFHYFYVDEAHPTFHFSLHHVCSEWLQEN